MDKFGYYQDLRKLQDYEKVRLFVTYDKNFWNSGTHLIEREIAEYKKLGLPPPIYAYAGKFLPGRSYTAIDPAADSLWELYKRTIIW